MSKWKYFSKKEVEGLDDLLVRRLDLARGLCGFPFIITSGYRPPDRNAAAGGVKDSEHTKGLAVDLRMPPGRFKRDKMVWALAVSGFRRGGSYTGHIHVDISTTKPEAFWDGGKSK